LLQGVPVTDIDSFWRASHVLKSESEFLNLDAAMLGESHESAAADTRKISRHLLGSISDFAKPVGGPMPRDQS